MAVPFWDAWHRACAAAGLNGRIPHDFRRTAARNLIAAPVDTFMTVSWSAGEGPAMLKGTTSSTQDAEARSGQAAELPR